MEILENYFSNCVFISRYAEHIVPISVKRAYVQNERDNPAQSHAEVWHCGHVLSLCQTFKAGREMS